MANKAVRRALRKGGRHGSDPVLGAGPKLMRAAKAGIVRPDWEEFTRLRRKEPESLLCDQVLRGDIGAAPNVVAMIKQNIRAAHRVIFDDSAAAQLAEVSSQCADLVVEHETFARQPWNPMWVEMYHENARWSAHRLGRLFTNNNVYIFFSFNDAEGRGTSGPGFVYHLHQPERKWSVRADLSSEQIDAFFLGRHAPQIPPHLHPAIRTNYCCSILWPELQEPDPMFNWSGATEGLDGDLIHVLATLLLLNRPGLVRYHTKPGGRTFIRGKSRPYLSHSTLHFVLDPKESLRALRNEHANIERDPLRWHAVRDHYCHNKEWHEYGSIGCIHKPIQTDKHWTPAPDLPPLACNHWVCTQCEGKRWRRVYKNGRGSAAVGFVQQDMTLVHES